MDLLGVEMEISGAKDRVFRLKKALQTADARQFGYVLVDCPPSLNLLTINAMAAAHSILVPLQCEFFALEGLSQLLETVGHVRATLNPELDIQGIVLTMYDSRNNLAHQVVDDVRSHLGSKVYRTLIPRNVRVSEAPVLRQACHSLRSQMFRQPGLSPAGLRSHPARAGTQGSVTAERGRSKKQLEWTIEWSRINQGSVWDAGSPR